MAQIYFMNGYGLAHVEEYLNEKGLNEIENDITNFCDRLDDKRHLITWSRGEEIGLAIGVGLNYPFEKAYFDTREECEEYIYNALKPFLRDDIDKKDILAEMDEYQDYEYQ